MNARRRAIPAFFGMIGFTVLGRAINTHFWEQWWFFVGLGTAISVTFAEPFFSRAQDGIVNGVAAMAAYLGAERANAAELWAGYLALTLLVICAGLAAALTKPDLPSKLKWLSNRIAARLGRASVLGFSALVLEVVGRANGRAAGWEQLALGVILLFAALTVNWSELLQLTRRAGTPTGLAIAAFGPHLLLASVPGISLSVGNSVRVTGAAGMTLGRIVSRMSHPDGLRYELALDDEWTAVSRAFPDAIVIEVEPSASLPVGGVVEAGSTDTRVTFQPLVPMAVGDPLWLQTTDAGELLYQVTSLRLERSTWAGAHALVPRADARQVGSTKPNGQLTLCPRLPKPHEPLYLQGKVAASLQTGHVRLGQIRGTGIPIGIAVEIGARGHVAVLGMSGMGKTAVAHRLAAAFGVNSLVVALDTTGEYASRLAFPKWDTSDMTTVGHYVHEPSGDPAAQCRKVVEQLMTAANAEYGAGLRPKGRVILLEEAHTFIPEWNYAGRSQQDNINYTTRLIMQARKFGVAFVIISQRTAVVSKSGLSQCENYVVLKTIDETSLSYMEAVVGSELRNTISSLGRFQALCVGPAFNTDGPVVIELDTPV